MKKNNIAKIFTLTKLVEYYDNQRLYPYVL